MCPALKDIWDVARELASDVTKLEYTDYGRCIRWRDTEEVVAYREHHGWVLTPKQTG